MCDVGFFTVVASACQSLCHLIRLIEFVYDIPRQQFIHAIDWMVGDALENVLQIAVRVDVIQLTCFNQTIGDRCALTTGV